MTTVRSLEVVDVLLILAFGLTKPVTEIRKKVNRIKNRAPKSCQVALTTILKSKEPKHVIRQLLEDMSVVPDTMKQFIEAGYPGMVIVDNELIPVNIDVATQEDGQWAFQHEDAVSYQIAQATLKETGLRGRLARVYLFKPAGFSGLIRDYRL